MKHLSPKSITVMMYLGTGGEGHYVEANDITFPSLEDRLSYLNQLEYKLWADESIKSFTNDLIPFAPILFLEGNL